jgi:hypothetical protein
VFPAPALLDGLSLVPDEQAAIPAAMPASEATKANVVEYFMTYLLEEDECLSAIRSRSDDRSKGEYLPDGALNRRVL